MNGFDFFASIIGSITWPIAIVIIAILFADELRTLIRRMQKFSVPSASIELAAHDAQHQMEGRAPEEIFTPAVTSVAVQNVEQSIRDHILNTPEGQRTSILIHELAKVRLLNHFYFIYTYIFGSQLKALRFAERQYGSCSVEEAVQFFHVAYAAYPDNVKDFTTDRWFQFILDNQLAIVRDNRFELTPIGIDFLRFVTASNLSEIRAY